MGKKPLQSDVRSKPLVRPGEPLQRTDKGLEIPVPTRGEFFDNMAKVAPKMKRRRRS